MTKSPKIDAAAFKRIVAALDKAGFAKPDIKWAESCGPPQTAEQFAEQAIYVICNSGMKHTIAAGIYDRVMESLRAGQNSDIAFGHEGKCTAIDRIWENRVEYVSQYLTATDKVAFCETLPWIGTITKYHLAKNFGVQVAKPDVHLQRLAHLNECTVQELCEGLAADTGYSVAIVDVLLWRACATGIMDSRTGSLIGS